METKKLTKDEIKQQIEGIKDWIHQSPDVPEDTDMLFKMYPFGVFKEAKEFVDKVSDIAENLKHYPTINLTAEYVNIMLWTSSLAGLTEKDFKLAKKIDELNQPAIDQKNFINPESE